MRHHRALAALATAAVLSGCERTHTPFEPLMQAASVPEGTKPVAVIFVNGILNSIGDPDEVRGELEKLAKKAGFSHLTDIYNVYNPGSSFGRDDMCLFRAIEQASIFDLLKCSSILGDISQSLDQMVRLLTKSPSPAQIGAKTLAQITSEELDQGRCVLLVGHSQGTLMIQEALEEIEAGACVAAMSLGAPIGRLGWPEWIQADLEGFIIAHERAYDILLRLGENDFPRLSTAYARELDMLLSEYDGRRSSLPEIVERAHYHLVLHNMPGSYLAPGESRDKIGEMLSRLVRRLARRSGYREPGARIYASSGQAARFNNGGPSDIWIVPPYASGADTLAGRIRTAYGGEPVMTDIARHPDGTLWGVSFHRLYRLRDAGNSTWIADEHYRFRNISGVNSLTFDPLGRAYAASDDGNIVGFELENMDFFLEGRLAWPHIFSGDLAFAPDGRLYSVIRRGRGNPDYLAEIDLDQWLFIPLPEPIGHENTWGLSFIGDELFGLTADTNRDKTGSLLLLDRERGAGEFVRNLAFDAFGAAGKPVP